jgi:hypothetical protein
MTHSLEEPGSAAGILFSLVPCRGFILSYHWFNVKVNESVLALALPETMPPTLACLTSAGVSYDTQLACSLSLSL